MCTRDSNHELKTAGDAKKPFKIEKKKFRNNNIW